MIKILPETGGNLFCVRLSGWADELDYEVSQQPVREGLVARERLRALFLLDDFKGWTLRGLWTRMRYYHLYSGILECLAVVGPEGDAEIYANLVATAEDVPAEVFGPGQYQEALHWLRTFDASFPRPLG